MTYQSPPGVFDIIPQNKKEVWKSAYIWNYVENILRQIAEEYGFQEIRTPVFEKTELLTRGIGETSDIVTKEMYTFEDKGGRSITLRPEGTAPVIRAFLENQLPQLGTQHRLFYIGPMFRYERAQAGRFRQHHQFGVEATGNPAPELDAEIIDMAYTIYTRLGIKDLTVSLNSIGTKETREKYREALKEYLSSKLSLLSKESQQRFEKNPLRILDSKDPQDQALVSSAPSILDFLDPESKEHFAKVQEYLTQLNIPFQVNPLLVRGLDYYNKTVFEIVSGNLGAQNSVCGGGRYDGLIQELGGPDLPAFGFATGIERILQTMIAQEVFIPPAPHPLLFLAPLTPEALKLCYALQKKLRDASVSCITDYSGRKLGKVMSYASQIGATYVAVIGDDEIASGEVALKEMSTGTTTKVPLKNLARILQVESCADHFISLLQEMSKPFESEAEMEFFIQKLNQSISETSKATHNLQSALLQIQNVLKSS